MTTERRGEAQVEDGILYIKREDDLFEVSSMDAVIELIGGEMYTIDRATSLGWQRIGTVELRLV